MLPQPRPNTKSNEEGGHRQIRSEKNYSIRLNEFFADLSQMFCPLESYRRFLNQTIKRRPRADAHPWLFGGTSPAQKTPLSAPKRTLHQTKCSGTKFDRVAGLLRPSRSEPARSARFSGSLRTLNRAILKQTIGLTERPELFPIEQLVNAALAPE